MINKTKKTKHFNFSAYECTAIEEFLEEMAREGWLLESIYNSRFKFTKIEPQELKFSVDPVSQVSTLDAPNSDIALEYREYCEAAGWKYLCEKGKLQIFYAPKESDTLPIHTDENEKYKSIFKSSLVDIFYKVLLMILFSINICIPVFGGSIKYFLSSNLSLVSLIIFIVLATTNIVEIVSFIKWSIKAKLELKNGDFLPYNNLKQLRRKILINRCIITSLLILFLLIIILDKNNFTSAATSVLMTLPMVLVIVFIDILTKKFLVKPKYSKRTNILIRLGSIIFTLWIGILVMLCTASGLAVNGFIGGNNISKESLPLTLNDFYPSSTKSTDLFIDESQSIIAREVYYSDSLDEEYLNYSLFESNHKWAIDTVVNSSIHSHEKTIKKHDPNFILKSPIIIDGVKVYSFDSDLYIFASDNKTIEINNRFDNMSNEDFISLVIKKVFTKDV